jgi:hypothetical protein
MLFSRYKADFLRFSPKIQQITFRFWCMNFKEKLPQNAGNRISEVLDFKISRGRIPPDPPTSARFSASVNKTTGSTPGYPNTFARV